MKLTKEQKHILDEKGTEKPFSGKYVKFDKEGNYYCVRCGNKLFSSDKKFFPKIIISFFSLEPHK